MTIEEALAKKNLGLLGLSSFPKIALNTLEQGLESENLIILAGMNDRDNLFEIEEYLNQTIKDLNIKNYKSNDAAFILANHYVEQAIQGDLTVIDAISNIKSDCWQNSKVQIRSNQYLFDSINFERIIGTWYDYFEVDDNANWVKQSKKSASLLKKEIENQLIKDLTAWKKSFLNKELNKLD